MPGNLGKARLVRLKMDPTECVYTNRDWDGFSQDPVSCPINNMAFVAIKIARRQGGPSRTGGKSGAYLNRYVTDEQRGRRPIFIATLRAVASWLFFRVARSSRINSDMLVVSASAARTALKNSQLTDGESHAIYGTGHQGWLRLSEKI